MSVRQLCLVGFLFAACDGFGRPEPLKSAAHVVQPTLTPTRWPGEPCHLEGSSVCRPGRLGPGLCLHYSKGLDANGDDIGYVCTTPCADNADCFEEFNCQDILPGEGNRVCLPHRDFQPRRALARAAAALPSPVVPGVDQAPAAATPPHEGE